MDKLKLQWPSDDNKTIGYVVHSFRVNDAEDPDLYAAGPMIDWEKTEKGKWIMEHSAPTPTWHKQIDHVTWGYKYNIKAYLSPKQLTYYKLKYE